MGAGRLDPVPPSAASTAPAAQGASGNTHRGENCGAAALPSHPWGRRAPTATALLRASPLLAHPAPCTARSLHTSLPHPAPPHLHARARACVQSARCTQTRVHTSARPPRDCACRAPGLPLGLSPRPAAPLVLPCWAPGGGCWRETALARLCQTPGGRCAAGVSLAGARNTASAGSSGVPLCSRRRTPTPAWGCRRSPTEGHPWVRPDPTPRPPHPHRSRCSRGLSPSVGPRGCGARRGAAALQPRCGARRRPGGPGREPPAQGRDPGIKNIPGTDFEPDKITSAARNVSPHPLGRPAASSPPQPHTAPSPTPLPAQPHSARPIRLQLPSAPHVSQGPFARVCTTERAANLHVCACNACNWAACVHGEGARCKQQWMHSCAATTHVCRQLCTHGCCVCTVAPSCAHGAPSPPPPAAWPCSTAGGAARRAGAVISRGMHSQGHSAQPAPRGWPHTSSASAAPCWCWDGVRPAAATPVAAALRREPTMLQLGAPVWLPVLARGLLPEAQPFVPRTTVPGEPLLVSSSLPAPGRVTWVGRGGGSRRSPGCRWGVGARGQRRCVTVFMRTSRSARDVRMALPAAALPGGTVPPRSPRRS